MQAKRHRAQPRYRQLPAINLVAARRLIYDIAPVPFQDPELVVAPPIPYPDDRHDGQAPLVTEL